MIFRLQAIRRHLHKLAKDGKAAIGFIYGQEFSVGIAHAVGHQKFIRKRGKCAGKTLKIFLNDRRLGYGDEPLFGGQQGDFIKMPNDPFKFGEITPGLPRPFKDAVVKG